MTNTPPIADLLATSSSLIFGEPNCTEPAIKFLLSESNTCMKILTWALTFFVCLVLSLSIIGIPLVLMGAQEYSRQSLAVGLVNKESEKEKMEALVLHLLSRLITDYPDEPEALHPADHTEVDMQLATPAKTPRKAVEQLLSSPQFQSLAKRLQSPHS